MNENYKYCDKNNEKLANMNNDFMHTIVGWSWIVIFRNNQIVNSGYPGVYMYMNINRDNLFNVVLGTYNLYCCCK